MIYALIVFAVTYALMLLFSKYRPVIALCSAVVFMVSGMLPANQIFSSIDFNVLMMIAGTMGLVQLFIDSRMPERLADMVMERVDTVQMAAVALALFAGIISAFVDNVATVLMVAPVALEICRKLKTNPVPFIIGIAVSSNLQGAATLVGDTTAIMLGSYADMSFLDFFVCKGKPGMFFAVELGAILSAGILAFIFRKEKGRIDRAASLTPVEDYVPTWLLLGNIVLLICASFLPEKPSITNGLICMTLLAVGLVYNFARKKTLDAITGPLKAIDFETIGILVGLFLIIGGITNMGVIDAAAGLLAQAGGGNVFLLYTIIVWASVLISAFIDNIPYTATMLPVVTGLAAALDIDPTLLYFGLLSGATLGGNITPIGASANITGIGILRKEGYEVKTSDFTRIGIPFTLAAVIPAYIYLWVFFH
ncbi:MAG: arsenic transporter [Candidatus Faecalibacterium intestinavium]|uniref:Arsenic transporter n=1 Tax=Candidatus Faecalibacterium intestinavium TaxID=2838580 RepID=A0A9E2NQ92_9FIRM|nr:arsenic transporter [Candidatus Faecalibacterium intestinavium]